MKPYLDLANDCHTKFAGLGLGSGAILALILKYGPRILEVLNDIVNHATPTPAPTPNLPQISTHA